MSRSQSDYGFPQAGSGSHSERAALPSSSGRPKQPSHSSSRRQGTQQSVHFSPMEHNYSVPNINSFAVTSDPNGGLDAKIVLRQSPVLPPPPPLTDSLTLLVA